METHTDIQCPEMVYSWIPSFVIGESFLYSSLYYRLRIGKKLLYKYRKECEMESKYEMNMDEMEE